MTDTTAMQNPFIVIALDGGAASGKSSTSGQLARRLNLLHVDTGSHYRAVTHACLQAGLPAEDGPPLRAFLSRLAPGTLVNGHESLIRFSADPPLRPDQLRAECVNNAVSLYAALPTVREAIKAYQRDQVALARTAGFAGLVMDGRDIGTVILPDADLKIFLTADPSTRQRRRTLEGGKDVVSARDHHDSTRAIAPLKPAPDAVLIDNSRLSLQQVVERVLDLLPSSLKPESAEPDPTA